MSRRTEEREKKKKGGRIVPSFAQAFPPRQWPTYQHFHEWHPVLRKASQEGLSRSVHPGLHTSLPVRALWLGSIRYGAGAAAKPQQSS